MFECKIVNTTKELSPLERIRVKENTDSIVIDKEFDRDPEIKEVIVPFGYAVELEIHNDASETKDYRRLAVVTPDNEIYTTGSKSAIEAFYRMYDELKDFDDWSLKFMRRPSRNRPGQTFLSCTVAL